MTSHLEVWAPDGIRVVTLGGPTLTIGRDGQAALKIDGDEMISRLHAVVEPLANGWTIRDLSSRNGTYVNGERTSGSRPLYSGDEIRVGSTRLVFRTDDAQTEAQRTRAGKPPPELTRREKDVLVELCCPLASGKPFAQPATVEQIARRLFVTEGAVRQHLGNLYDKFEMYDEGSDRRVQLAGEAILRGAVSQSELTERAMRESE